MRPRPHSWLRIKPRLKPRSVRTQSYTLLFISLQIHRMVTLMAPAWENSLRIGTVLRTLTYLILTIILRSVVLVVALLILLEIPQRYCGASSRPSESHEFFCLLVHIKVVSSIQQCICQVCNSIMSK